MQTVETLNEGLKRGFRITIPAQEIDAKIDAELKTIAPQVRMPGFRPARCPPISSARCMARASSSRRWRPPSRKACSSS
jgi:FKBP-type peptidyl-prolyl cis-trans isomerase (trigger factor)